MTINPAMITFLKDFAIANFTQLVKLTDNGVKAIQEMIEINSLNKKIEKIKSDINKYYIEIGKEVYKNHSSINNAIIKESIGLIKQCEKEIDDKSKEIDRLKQKAKEEGATETDLELIQSAIEEFDNKNISVTVPSKKKNINKRQVKKTQASKLKNSKKRSKKSSKQKK